MRVFIVSILICFCGLSQTRAQIVADTTQANEYLLKAESFQNRAWYDSSCVYFQKAASVYEKIYQPAPSALLPFVQKHIACMNRVAEMLFKLQKHEQSLQTSQQVLQYSKIYLPKNNEEEAIACRNIAAVHQHEGEYSSALEFYTRVLAIKKGLYGEKSAPVAYTYNLIGALYHQQGAYDNALENHQKSLALRRSLYGEHHQEVANSCFHIGNVLFSKNNYDGALEQYDKSASIYKDLYGEKDISIARCYNNMGLMYRHKRAYKQALEFYQKALAIKRDIYGEKHPDLADTYNNIGNIHKTKGSYALALRQYQKAICANVSDFNDTTSTDLNPPNIGKCYNQDYLLTSLLNKARVLETIYELSTNPKNLKVALQTFQVCEQLIEDMRLAVTARNEKIDLEKKAEKMYETAVRISYALYRIYLNSNRDLAQEYYEQAFYFAEKNKYSLQVESVSAVSPRIYQGVADSLLEKEKNYQTEIAFWRQRLAEKPNPETEKVFQKRLASAQHNYEALITQFRSLCPRYYSLKYEHTNVSVTDLQMLLDKKTALVEYFLSENTVFVFTITSKECSLDTMSISRRLQADMQQGILQRDAGKYIRCAAELYKTLFPRPLPKTVENLVLIPEGFLKGVSFNALLTEPVTVFSDYNRLPYLIKKYSLSYVYSASLFYLPTLLALRAGTPALNGKLPPAAAAAPASGNFAGYAPVFTEAGQQIFASGARDVLLSHDADTIHSHLLIGGKQVMPLPGSKVEIESIADMFKAEKLQAEIQYGAQARESLVKSPQTRVYPYLHFATHAFVSEKNPAHSGILLAAEADDQEDGILYTDELFSLNLNAELVVLSGCETGIGKLSKGEGINAFTRGLMYAGAKNILFSLWKVPEPSTTEMMLEIYDLVLAEKSGNPAYSEILQRVNLQMIGSKKFANPYYWAGFVLIGHGN